MIANTIIKNALRRLNIIGIGSDPTTAMYTEGLEVLNDIVASWSGVRSLIYENTREELSIPASTQSFTIGASGDQTTARPIEVLYANLKSGNEEYKLTCMDGRQYNAIDDKSITSLPSRFHYRDTHPNGTFYFDRTTDKAYTLVLTSIKELTQFPDGTTDVSMPAYYEKAFKDNLLVEIAPQFGAAKRITQLMLMSAEESKNVILGRSLRPVAATTDINTRGSYNIESDSY